MRAGRRTSGGEPGHPRGVVLLEVVMAVAILLMASITITGAVNEGVRGMQRSRLELRAADLARSAMAEIEAGVSTPEALNGPVRAEAGTAGGGGDTGVNAGVSDAPPGETGWELEVGVTASPFAGLSKVSVRALKRPADGGGGDANEASYTLEQLVRLSARTEDRAGEEGDLTRESERGLRTNDRVPARESPPPPGGLP